MPNIDEMNVEKVTGEDAPETELPALNVDVIIAREVPRIEIPVTNSVGKVIRMRKIVDKSAIFALPAGELRKRAQIFSLRPSGRVLVSDAAGALVARFASAEQAAKHLKAAGIDPCKLIGWPKAKKK